MLSASHDCGCVSDDSDSEARDDGYGQQGSEFRKDRLKREDTAEMQEGEHQDRGVKRPNSTTIIPQLLPSQICNWFPGAPNSRHQAVTRCLENNECPVHGPSFETRECVLVYEGQQVGEEIGDGLRRVGEGKVPIVECGADVHVVH